MHFVRKLSLVQPVGLFHWLIEAQHVDKTKWSCSNKSMVFIIISLHCIDFTRQWPDLSYCTELTVWNCRFYSILAPWLCCRTMTGSVIMWRWYYLQIIIIYSGALQSQAWQANRQDLVRPRYSERSRYHNREVVALIAITYFYGP